MTNNNRPQGMPKTECPLVCRAARFCGSQLMLHEVQCKLINLKVASSEGVSNNRHTQRKLLNFENWVNGLVSKSAKVNFLHQKLSEFFSFFFSLKNINLGAHFLLLTFFDNIDF